MINHGGKGRFMAKDSSEDSRYGELRREAIRVLQILSRFYSYRVLERIYGIHFQNLWRYAMLLSIPERETAEKIVSKTREMKLLEKTLREKASETMVNGCPHVLLRDTGFLQLASYMVLQKLREIGEPMIDSVIAASPESLPLATVLALELDAEVCLASDKVRAEPKGVLVTHFKSMLSGEVSSILIPKQCLEGDNNVIIVETDLKDPTRVSVLASLAKRTGARVLAIVTLKAERDSVEELARAMPDVYLIRLIDESQEQRADNTIKDSPGS